MKTKNLLFAGMLLCVMCGLGSAFHYNYYSGSGVETFTQTGSNAHDSITKVAGAGSPFYYQAYMSISGVATEVPGSGYDTIISNAHLGTENWDFNYDATHIGNYGYYYWDMDGSADGLTSITATIVCSDEPFVVGISGNTCGVDNVTCFINTTGDYIENCCADLTESNYYEFDVANNTDYKLVFGDGHEYEFTYNGTSIVYDYNLCDYITINFYDRCSTHIKDLQIFYWSTTDPVVNLTRVDGYQWDGFLFGDNVEIGDNIYILCVWYDGSQKYVYTITESPKTINIVDIPIDYEMGIRTVTNTGVPISGVRVSINQDCNYGGTQNKITSGGWCWFNDCSNTGGSLTVSKPGYKTATMPFPTLMATAWQYRTSYIITLELDGSANDTQGDFNDTIIDMGEVIIPGVEYDLDGNNSDLHGGVEIWFVDESGYRTTSIADTDSYVDLWFVNKNSGNSPMALEFQQSYTGNYYWDELSWNIPYKKFGFKRIYNVNFTPHNYYYRGNIYNDSLSQWNRIKYLEVGNKTLDEEIHYENLTTHLWFQHATIDHKMDYRNDIEIVCNAASNNSTLLDLDIELYDNAVLVDYINLTWADFAGASIKWFYVWYPNHDYVTGHNYTTKMVGYDGYILRTDHVDCYTDAVIRKNKLTIGVKDRFGNNLNNCYIYLEDWGSLPTGSTYYNSYEGIDNGYYRYKASKSGYTGTGWADITMSDDDEIVWYTLTEDHTNLSTTQQKLTDDDIKGMFFPLMFFLLICIIFGGFKYVTN
jgi:hypothetical protein